MLGHGREWSPDLRVGIQQQCLTSAGWRLAQRHRSVSAATPADVKSDGKEGGGALSRLGGP